MSESELDGNSVAELANDLATTLTIEAENQMQEEMIQAVDDFLSGDCRNSDALHEAIFEEDEVWSSLVELLRLYPIEKFYRASNSDLVSMARAANDFLLSLQEALAQHPEITKEMDAA